MYQPESVDGRNISVGGMCLAVLCGKDKMSHPQTFEERNGTSHKVGMGKFIRDSVKEVNVR